MNNSGHYFFIPMNKESDASNALVDFIQHAGIPSTLHTNGAKALTGLMAKSDL
jgi:hypothetical protein